MRAQGSGVIQSVTLTDADKQSAAIDVLFFSAPVSHTTLTDKAALALNALDLVNYLGHVAIVATSYSAFSANSAATVACNLPIVIPAGSTLYALLVSRGAPTYTTTSSLVLGVGIGAD